MPRKTQAPRWEQRPGFFHGYTEYGVTCITHGFVLRIQHPERFKDYVFMNELGHNAIYKPHTGNTPKHIEDDLQHSILTDESVENLVLNLHVRMEEGRI